MRLKRSEYEELKTRVSILEEVSNNNNTKFRIMDINDKLSEYGLRIEKSSYLVYSIRLSWWFKIYNYDDESIKHIDTLDDFDSRFEWYKDGIEEMEIIRERDEYFEEKDKSTKKVLNSKKK